MHQCSIKSANLLIKPRLENSSSSSVTQLIQASALFCQFTEINIRYRGLIALPSVKYSGRVETDVLGGARRVASQPFVKITIYPEPCMTINAAGEATKKRPVFERLLLLSAAYFQG